MGRGDWQAIVHRVAKSWTLPEQLTLSLSLQSLHVPDNTKGSRLFQRETSFLFEKRTLPSGSAGLLMLHCEWVTTA